jgi:LPXTG-site transpeptidase (sortase) family protein
MATSPHTDPKDAPHLSLAARRLLAHSRQQAAPVRAALVLKRTSTRRAWLLVALPPLLLLIGVIVFGTWWVWNGQLQSPDFTAIERLTRQWVTTPTPQPQPTDAEFSALLEAELEETKAETQGNAPLLTAPPQADPPKRDAPALPQATPTPAPDPKVRPLPWPYVPAAGRPDRIYAPHVGLDAEIKPVGFSIREMNGYLVRIYEVARWAAGWHTNSSLPGWQGNTVLAGHHNAWGSVFRPALSLEPGDFLFVEADGVTYSYLVVIKETLPETNFEERRANGRWIAQTEDERLTLVTCWPPDGNTHRVVIVAIPAK